MQGINGPASAETDSRNHPVSEETALIYEMDAAADVENRDTTGTERMGAECTGKGTGASHAAVEEKELARGSGRLIRRAGLETIDECSNDVSICNDKGFEPNLSESVTFPCFSAERPVTPKSRADSLLYVSSSSEGDFISKAKGTHLGRHCGGVSVNESGDSTSDKGGREGVLNADPDAAQEHVIGSDMVHCATDDSNHGDHSPEGSSDDASDAGDRIDSLDGAEGSVQHPLVSYSVVSEVIDAPTPTSQSASCASISNGNALLTHRVSDSVPCTPLAESDVAPFLKDEITAMLWARLCKIREQMAAAETAAYIQ
jgi:hypothetical protein